MSFEVVVLTTDCEVCLAELKVPCRRTRPMKPKDNRLYLAEQKPLNTDSSKHWCEPLTSSLAGICLQHFLLVATCIQILWDLNKICTCEYIVQAHSKLQSTNKIYGKRFDVYQHVVPLIERK